MTVFKTFFKVLKKYSVSILIYLGIGVSLIFILSSINSKGNTAYEAIGHGIVIVDNDKSEVSKGLEEYLGSINEIKSGTFTNEQIINMLYYTKITNYIVIPSGFGEAFLSGSKDLPRIESTKDEASRMGYSIETEVESYLNLTANYMKGGYSLEEAQKLSAESLSDVSAVNMVSEVKVEDDKMYTVFAMLPYIIMTMLLSAILPVILRFSSELIRVRTEISSTSSSKKQVWLALACFIVTIGIVIFLIVFATLISQGQNAFTDRWWLAVLNVVIMSMTIVMLIIALSNFKIKPEVAPGVTNVIALSFSFLGGIFVPMEVLGGTAKTIGQFLPTYWYSEAMQKIKTGGSFGDIAVCLGIQLLFGIMIMIIGMLYGRYNLKKAE